MSIKKVLLLIITIIVIFRFYDLEKDPPAYNISGINVTDESYYCLSGVEEYLKDENRLEEKLQISPAYFYLDHNHYLTYTCLKIFGSNYIGLRVGVVLLSLLTIIILFYLFKHSEYYHSSYSWLFLAFIGFDFYFFLFSRYQTPQLYSIFWLTVSLFFVSLSEKKKLFIILAAFALFLSNAWVYPYTAFASTGFAIWIFYESIRTWSLKPFYYAISGVIIGVLFLLFSFWMDNKTIYDYINALVDFNTVRDETVKTFSIKTLIANLLQIPYTNLLRFNPFLFLVLVFGIFYSMLNFKKTSTAVKFSFFCILAAFMQSLLMNSYPFKKWIMVYPFIITLAPMVYYHIVTSTNSKSKKILLLVLSLFVMFMGIQSIRINNLSIFWSGFSEHGTFEPLPFSAQWILYTSLIIMGVLPIILLYSNKFWIKTVFTISVFIPLFSLNIYYLVNTRHTYKNALTEIGQRIGNSIIVGDYSHAYVYYNSAIPSYNPYMANVHSSAYHEIFEKKIQEMDKPLFYISDNTKESPLPPEISVYNKKFKYFCGNKFGLYSEISENEK